MLADGTAGTLKAESIDFNDPEDFIGQFVLIHLHDENGNEIEEEGILEEVLTQWQ